MKNIGVICEYNPFHNGHAAQLRKMKEAGNTVCLMSGNYVQRGEPALFNKYIRAQAAVSCGADLVLELPLTYVLRSAEGFADGGVELLELLGCVDTLCFGSESGEEASLFSVARELLSERFSQSLQAALATGVSFPKARQEALAQLGGAAELLREPNDILAVEYCKAILRRGASLKTMVLRRCGSYHDSEDRENPSASYLRTHAVWNAYVPPKAMACFTSSTRYRLRAGERAMLARLRAMTEAEFAALPFGSEGLWRRLLQTCREANGVEEIVAAVKTKRYTRSRLMRMLLCAYLGISAEQLVAKAPYVRVLAFNERGRQMLRQMRSGGKLLLINAGQTPPDAVYAELERRAADLYGLFADAPQPTPPGTERRARVVPL